MSRLARIALIGLCAVSFPGIMAAQTKPPAAAAAKAAVGKATVGKAAAGQAAAAAPLVDINRATVAELEAIPGIGKAYAAKIIAGRPYGTKAGLVQKNILSAALYDKIRDRIIAKQ
ncbi:ComEA family DNA-binding protein [Gemmatimonas sp.]